MTIRIRAEPGDWYLNRDTGDVFQVVGVSERGDSVEVQLADGAVDEFLMDDWNTMSLEKCGQPEDWEGPFDDLVPDDIGLPESTSESHGGEVPMERALLGIEEKRSLGLVGTDEE